MVLKFQLGKMDIIHIIKYKQIIRQFQVLQRKLKLGRGLYQFPKATVTNYFKLSGLKQQKLIPHSSGGQESKTKVSVRLYSLLRLQERIISCPFQWIQAFIGLQQHNSNLCLYTHMTFPCVSVSSMSLCLQISLSL